MKPLGDVETIQIEYLSIISNEILELKVYRCTLRGSGCENGLLVRQAEYLIERLPRLSRNISQGYVIMFKGIEFNHFRFGLFNERNRKIIAHNYSISTKCKSDFKVTKNDGEVFFTYVDLHELIRYESSLVGYIKRKGHYSDYHFSA